MIIHKERIAQRIFILHLDLIVSVSPQQNFESPKMCFRRSDSGNILHADDVPRKDDRTLVDLCQNMHELFKRSKGQDVCVPVYYGKNYTKTFINFQDLHNKGLQHFGMPRVQF